MNKNMSFETAIARLDEIVAKLENGGETLDASMKLFEEGSALAAHCHGKLEKAEQKIVQLSRLEEQAAAPEENADTKKKAEGGRP